MFAVDLNLSGTAVTDAAGLTAVQTKLEEYGKIGRVTSQISSQANCVASLTFTCYDGAPTVDLSIMVRWLSFTTDAPSS